MTYTRAQLEAAGLVVNTHLWIGNGWFHCRTCARPTYHYVMALPAPRHDVNFELCSVCHTYWGARSLPGASNDDAALEAHAVLEDLPSDEGAPDGY